MKKSLSCLLSILLLFGLAGCASENAQSSVQSDAPQSDIHDLEAPGTGSYVITVGKTRDDLHSSGYTLTENETAAVITAMGLSEFENGWADDVTNSAVSHVISVKAHDGEVIYNYSADSGVFNDPDNMRSLRLTESEKDAVNDILSKYVFETPSKNIDFNAQYIRTNGYSDGEVYPKTLWITSPAELEAYYELNKDKYDLGSRANPGSDQTLGFADAIKAYDSAFFESNDLILVVLEEGSGSIRHEVTAVELLPSIYDRVRYFIQPYIKRVVPEVGTADMAEWHIMIEVSKEYGMSASELKEPIIR